MIPCEQREWTMPANLTLKGVPDEVYERLKEAATVSHRSLNSEIIAVLESHVLPRRVSAQDHLSAIRAARARLKRTDFDHTRLDAVKREGRA
jgi:plasmid stability protein